MTIPGSITSIGDAAFFGCSGLTSITIPGSVTSIGIETFQHCTNLTGIIVDASNPSYTSQNGVLYSKDMKTLITYPGGHYGGFSIPSSVTSIENCAFFRCSGLTGITIPNSVTSIGDNAFYECTGLTSVTFQSPNRLTSIGYYSFLGCTGLATITIPPRVKSIKEQAFYGCSNLACAFFLGNAPTMGVEVFDNCHFGFTVFYRVLAKGFTSPTWYGYPSAVECPAKKALGENNPKLENLRDFRDSTLAQSAVGRKAIEIYYNNADSINDALDRSPVLREFTRRVLELIAPMVGKK